MVFLYISLYDPIFLHNHSTSGGEGTSSPRCKPAVTWRKKITLRSEQHWQATISHDGSMYDIYIYANMTGVFVDGIHGAPYIAAPWIRHGICNSTPSKDGCSPPLILTICAPLPCAANTSSAENTKKLMLWHK